MKNPGLNVRYGQPNVPLFESWLKMRPEEDGPFWAVNLMRYRDAADYADGRASTISGREADDLYAPFESLAAVGAEVVFAANVETQLLGSPAWDRIGVVKYPSRRAMIEMQSRPDFIERHVHKDAGVEQTIVMACQPMLMPQPPEDAPDPADVPYPSTTEDGPVIVLHVLRFKERQGIENMASYTESAAQVAIPHGARIAGWFTVDGTMVGDGREWDQVRFNAFPSRAAFMAVVRDPARLKAQREHRETAIADTYTMILRPIIDRLAKSIEV